MNILKNYYKATIRYDLLNKFFYSNLKDIPKLKKIILNFGCKNSDVKIIASAFLSLELISEQRGSLIRSKRSNMLLKIRKGSPVGCMVVLKKQRLYNFFLKLLVEIFPNLKDFKGVKCSKRLSPVSFSFTLKELISFQPLEKQFYLFNNLPPLNITIIANTRTKKELVHLLSSFKLPII